MKKRRCIYIVMALLALIAFGCEKKQMKMIESNKCDASVSLSDDNEYTLKKEINSLPGNAGSLDENTPYDKNANDKNEYVKHGLIADAVSCEFEQKTVREKVSFSPDTNPNEIPFEKELKFYDPSRGKDVSINGKLVETGEDFSQEWVSIKTVEATFIGSDINETDLEINDELSINMNLSLEAPVWDGYEEDLKRIYSIEEYTLEDASWVSDIIQTGCGFVRQAEYRFKCKEHGTYAIYEGEGRVPKQSMSTNTFCKYAHNDYNLLTEYREMNSEVLGIIRINGTVLNHPLMRCEKDEDFYLWHDLNKRYNSHGIPFVTLESDIDSIGNNTLIYGHRLNDKDVFSQLSDYKNIEFYKEHPVIETVTDSGTARWLIIGFCILDNYDEKFYYFDNYRFNSKEQFDAYMKEMNERNFIVSPYEYSIEDTYITLSSCSTHRNAEATSRMIVTAVKIPYDFDVEKTVELTTYK